MDPPRETEAELERFRRQWQEEVSKRNKQAGGSTASAAKSERRKQPAPAPAAAAAAAAVPAALVPSASAPSASASKPHTRHLDAQDDNDGNDGHELPSVYHDLPDVEAELRLDAADHGLTRGSSKKAEPESALEHYERAVEKETQGSLGDSLKHYRRAFKLDDRVHEQYKNKHFPPSAFPPKRPAQPPPQQKPSQTNPSNAPVTVPNAAHHSLQADVPLSSIPDLVQDFSLLSIPGAPAPTDADPPPPCPISELPEELLSDVIKYCAITDVASLSRLSQVCKRFAYLVMTEQQVWRRICEGHEYGFAAMHYDYVCDLDGQPLDDLSDVYPSEEGLLEDETQLVISSLKKTNPAIDAHLLTTVYRSSWRQMFRQRPRIRFNGCYISTVNYNRPGAASTDTRTWGAPIHVVTYFRYLRFFRDGSVISLLTTAEPVDVVHHMVKENLPNRRDRTRNQYASALPSAVMKDALKGRWHLGGPGEGVEPPDELQCERDLHIETEGVLPKYMWKMEFSLASAGRKDGSRNNKLNWKGFWSYNKLTDDWGEFGLKNDKAFYFSRVKSYGNGEG